MPEVNPVSTIEDDSIDGDDDTKMVFLSSEDDRNSLMNVNKSFTGVPITDTQLKLVLNKTYFFDKSIALGNKDEHTPIKSHKKKKRKVNNKKDRIEIEIDKNLNDCINRNDKTESNLKKDEHKDSSKKIIHDENKIKKFEDKVEGKEKEKKKDEEKDEDEKKEKERIIHTGEGDNDIVEKQADDNDCETEDNDDGGDENINKTEEIDENDSSKETIETSSENASKITTNNDESEENGMHLNEMIANEIKRWDLKTEKNKNQDISQEPKLHKETEREGYNNDHIEKDLIIDSTELKLKKSKKTRKQRKKKKLVSLIEPIEEHIEEAKVEHNNESKSLRSLSPFKFKDNTSISIKNNEENSLITRSINEDRNDKFAIKTFESKYAIDICDQITFSSPIKDLEINSGDNFEINDNEKLNEKNEINSINRENIEDNEIHEPFSYNSSHLDDENCNHKEKDKKKRKRNSWLHNWFKKIDASKDEDFDKELREVLIEENSLLGTGSYMLQQIRENLKQMFLFEKRQALTEEKLKSLEDSVKRQNQTEGLKVEEKDCIMLMSEEKGTMIKKVIEGRVLIIENQPLMDRLKTQGKRADKELKNQLIKYIKMGDIFIFDNIEGKKYITIDISNLK